jgi:hypothetical protein
MRIALAIFSLLLVGGLAFCFLRRHVESKPTSLGVDSAQNAGTSVAVDPVSSNDGMVSPKPPEQTRASTANPAPTVANRKPSSPPIGSTEDVSVSQIDGVVVTATAETATSPEYEKKYKGATKDDLRVALDDLRGTIQSLDPNTVPPETFAEIKRELTWLEAQVEP